LILVGVVATVGLICDITGDEGLKVSCQRCAQLNVIKFEIFQKKFLKWRAKSPQKVAFRMPFHYFSPFISLLFTNPKVTNCPAIRYFFTYFPCSMVKLVYFENSDLGIKK
jgi:hypothetical protein